MCHWSHWSLRLQFSGSTSKWRSRRSKRLINGPFAMISGRQSKKSRETIDTLSNLVFLFRLMWPCRRLRCPRNNLHLHLFTSFIIRSSVFLLKPLFVAVPHEEVLSITSSVTVNSFASIPLANVTGDTGESNYLVNVTGNYVSNYRSDVLSGSWKSDQVVTC